MIYSIEHYIRPDGRIPFEEWYLSLRDEQVKARILVYAQRLRFGNFGNCKSLSKGLSELKIDVGPGYRVYYTKIGTRVILFICSGDKKSQKHDIQLAADYLTDYKKRKKEMKDADKKA